MNNQPIDDLFRSENFDPKEYVFSGYGVLSYEAAIQLFLYFASSNYGPIGLGALFAFLLLPLGIPYFGYHFKIVKKSKWLLFNLLQRLLLPTALGLSNYYFNEPNDKISIAILFVQVGFIMLIKYYAISQLWQKYNKRL